MKEKESPGLSVGNIENIYLKIKRMCTNMNFK